MMEFWSPVSSKSSVFSTIPYAYLLSAVPALSSLLPYLNGILPLEYGLCSGMHDHSLLHIALACFQSQTVVINSHFSFHWIEAYPEPQ